jgi:hypothetical protein
MPEKIKWSVQFQVVGGLGIAKSQELEVDAYDKVSETIPADGSDVVVNIQPNTDPNDVQLLVINAEPCGSWLTYKVDSDAQSVVLDAPHTLIGAGAVSLMSPTAPPKKLTFTIDSTNQDAKESVVQILVGRDAS